MNNKFTAKLGDDGWTFLDPNGRPIITVDGIEIDEVKNTIYELNEFRFDFNKYLRDHMGWSIDAFGEGSRTEGIIEHIEEELEEVKENPKDVREWVDVISLAIDGALREGAAIGELKDAMLAVQLRNKYRKWHDTPPNRKAKHIEE